MLFMYRQSYPVSFIAAALFGARAAGQLVGGGGGMESCSLSAVGAQRRKCWSNMNSRRTDSRPVSWDNLCLRTCCCHSRVRFM